MNEVASVRATVMVDVEVAVAFEIFTKETAAWYQPVIAGTPSRSGSPGFDADTSTLTFESGVGGRLLRGSQRGGPETEVEVRFDAVGDRTRVSLEHRGLDQLPPGQGVSAAQYGWRRLAFQFETYCQVTPANTREEQS